MTEPRYRSEDRTAEDAATGRSNDATAAGARRHALRQGGRRGRVHRTVTDRHRGNVRLINGGPPPRTRDRAHHGPAPRAEARLRSTPRGAMRDAIEQAAARD